MDLTLGKYPDTGEPRYELTPQTAPDVELLARALEALGYPEDAARMRGGLRQERRFGRTVLALTGNPPQVAVSSTAQLCDFGSKVEEVAASDTDDPDLREAAAETAADIMAVVAFVKGEPLIPEPQDW